ncbi:peptidoglycan DD-metalloendopeptidase family protein [Alicyclobacillus mali]|uniref:Peptidoglycan DD-metalloendopeptidase family protein n=1 Tax=Alicyclobacillus mali (ex Roth et al. 2021) TaxID=1123961 RepID=A0ABS0F632_9BACL|nr:peptidoglycan DD-metalloendopeptidase family protein [Alicyclobacillus mali (ex Roth et al. 2021)]MBF8378744.1 peptidoglycan DD-metalloendopeptidase family protein [Alicyclobacillus mali (ex Roth et al. 2021)]MCL6488215.1 peptidoglycan DD-metalloendopeptidase family protein [Alicyclobacillus mali (ex Roth et al. 2021)]
MPRNLRVWSRRREEPPRAGDSTGIKTDAREAPSRWTSDPEGGDWPESPLSPYGYADDDGGIRQVESAAWRRPLTSRSARQNRGFQPHASGDSAAVRRTSRLTWQLFGAFVLVAAGYTLQHDPRIPSAITAQAVNAFDADFSSRVQPELDRLLASLHLHPLSLGVTQATTLRAPVFGRVIQSFGPDHPEVWVQGDAGDPVQAAAPGTVLGVYQTGNTYLVKIDHGADGIALYGGLGSVAVHPDDVVLAGQEIGTLPKRPAHPVFRFSIEKSGKFENPERWVSFSGGSA